VGDVLEGMGGGRVARGGRMGEGRWWGRREEAVDGGAMRRR
jgi:hypothetical protein